MRVRVNEVLLYLHFFRMQGFISVKLIALNRYQVHMTLVRGQDHWYFPKIHVKVDHKIINTYLFT